MTTITFAPDSTNYNTYTYITCNVGDTLIFNSSSNDNYLYAAYGASSKTYPDGNYDYPKTGWIKIKSSSTVGKAMFTNPGILMDSPKTYFISVGRWNENTQDASGLGRLYITITQPTTTNLSVNVNGTWKEADAYVNVNGTWKEAEAFTNVNGSWKS